MADTGAEYEQAIIDESREAVRHTHSDTHYQDPEETSSTTKDNTRTAAVEAEDSSSETSPLLSPGHHVRRRPVPSGRASASYMKAVNEPWDGAYRQANRPWYKKPSIYWLFPAFFPICIAIGGAMVPKTYLTIDLICRQYFSDKAARDPTYPVLPVFLGADNPQCDAPEVAQLVAYFTTYSNLLSGIPSAIVGPYFGSLSDRIGRTKVMVAVSTATLLSDIVTIIVGKYPERFSVYWLLFGFFIDGVCGSFTTGLALSMAYASDCTAPEKRAVSFGMFHGLFFTGFAIGPILSGYLTKVTNSLLVPFYVAVGCQLYYIVFLGLFVPESLSEERQVVAREKYAEQTSKPSGLSWVGKIKQYNIFEPLWTLRPTGEGTSPALRRNLVIMSAIDFMMFGVSMSVMTIITVYAKSQFGWDPLLASYFMSAGSLTRAISLFALLPILSFIFRGRSRGPSKGHRGSDLLDLNIIRVSLVLDLIGYFGYAVAPATPIMFLSSILAALGGMAFPTISSSMTKHVPANMTGQILGASSLLHALARVIAPPVFNIIFAQTVFFYPSCVFVIIAAVFVVIFVLSWFLKPEVYLVDKSVLGDEPQHGDQSEARHQNA